MRCDVDAGQVDLVQRHDDRHAGRPGVADGFFGLRHDAVVGGHDQHGDIGDVGAAGPHFGEGFVARRIDEGDLAAVLFDLVGANVLRDAAAFAADHVDADDLDPSSDVLPWSTCPRNVMTGRARLERAPDRPRSSHSCEIALSARSTACLKSISTPSSTASSSAISGSISALMLAMVPSDSSLPQHLLGRDADRFGKAADGAGQLERDLALARSGGVRAGALDDARRTAAAASSASSSSPRRRDRRRCGVRLSCRCSRPPSRPGSPRLGGLAGSAASAAVARRRQPRRR